MNAFQRGRHAAVARASHSSHSRPGNTGGQRFKTGGPLKAARHIPRGTFRGSLLLFLLISIFGREPFFRSFLNFISI
jgi:hypothetical protein